MRNLRVVFYRNRRSLALPVSIAFLAISILLTARLFIPALSGESPRLRARSAVVIDGTDGRVLFAKNPSAPAFPASTAKILTALIALEKADPSQIVSVGTEIRLVARDSSKAGLKVGDRIRLKDLVGGMLLPSGNDAAYAIAVHVARPRSHLPRLSTGQALARFVGWMNERAARIGAVHSHFTTPDGYHRADQVTTAYDLALIAREAMKHPLFREIAGAPEYAAARTISTGNLRRKAPPGTDRVRWENRNKLLDAAGAYFYPGASGIKTGHTVEAGYCLVSSARRDGRERIAVVLDSSETGVWTDSIALLDFGFRKRTAS